MGWAVEGRFGAGENGRIPPNLGYPEIGYRFDKMGLSEPKGRPFRRNILKAVLVVNHQVHLKDVRPPVIEQVRREGLSFLDGVKKGTFTVPGDGVIDFRPVFKLLDEHGYKRLDGG